MKFTEAKLKGAFIIKPEKIEDERGFFARTFCVREFAEHGLNTKWVQCSTSVNKKKGIRHGMHYQLPYAEDKLIRCTAGAIYDVIVDLREESPTYKEWVAIELSAQNRISIYIPKRFAHGYQALRDNVEVFYQMSEFHHPEAAMEISCDDSELNISWPERNIWSTIPVPLSHP